MEKPEPRVRISVSVTLSQKVWIEKKAQDLQVSEATIARWAMTQYIDREKEKA